MVEGGWPFVWAAYALTIAPMAALSVIVALRARHWARQARALEEKRK
jgi:heme exporter protein CcmD